MDMPLSVQQAEPALTGITPAAVTPAKMRGDLIECGAVAAYLTSLSQQITAGSLSPAQLVEGASESVTIEREASCAATLRGVEDLYSAYISQLPGYLANLDAVIGGTRTDALREVLNIHQLVRALELKSEWSSELVVGTQAIRRLLEYFPDESIVSEKMLEKFRSEGVPERFIDAYRRIARRVESPQAGINPADEGRRKEVENSRPVEPGSGTATLSESQFKAELRENEALDPAARSVKERLAVSRMDLVDAGLRNPMLNYRSSKARGVDIVQGDSQKLYDRLVTDQDSFTFEAAAVLPSAVVAAHPGRLPTGETPASLQKRLLNTAREARLSIEEQGSNTLFLVLGMVHWKESDSPETERRAPLIMIPVTLEKNGGPNSYKLVHSGEEIEQNPALAAKLREEHGIELPKFAAGDDFTAYVQLVKERLAGNEFLRLAENDCVLGFISFARQAMYRDLDSDNWPADRKPWNDRQIQALYLGGYGASAGVIKPREGRIDAQVDHSRQFPVVESDSSQMGVLADVEAGHDLLTRGPPGTGKSQTITNIIAQAVADGKTVLFVSEKMAALQVVKARLDAAGLGELCLELHSHDAAKRDILQQIEATLDSHAPKKVDRQGVLDKLHTASAGLNDYCDQLGAGIGQSGTTPWKVIGRLLELGLDRPGRPTLPATPMMNWTGSQFEIALARVAEFQARGLEQGDIKQNPFFGSQLIAFLPTEGSKVTASSRTAYEAGTRLQTKVDTLFSKLGLTSGCSISQLALMVNALERIALAPNLEGVTLDDPAFSFGSKVAQEMIATGERYAAKRAQYGDTVAEKAWTTDYQGSRDALSAIGSRWFGARWYNYWTNRNYGQALLDIAEICRQNPPKTLAARLAVFDDLAQARRDGVTIDASDRVWSSALGKHWNRTGSDWVTLKAITEWVTGFSETFSSHPQFSQLRVIAQNPELRRIVALEAQGLAAELRTYVEAQKSLFDLIDFSDQARTTWATRDSLKVQLGTLERCAAEVHRLTYLSGYNSLAKGLKETGLDFVVTAFENATAAQQAGLTESLEYTWNSGLIERAYHERKALAEFNRGTHERTYQQYVASDRQLLACNAVEIMVRHWEQQPRINSGGQIGTLRKEIEKGSRHLPIRKLLLEAGDAVQQVKPVFMMSPASIAKFLDPRSIQFDLVVFDEASQVRPVEAMGALLRAQQGVIVGDGKQLPPSNFFDSGLRSEDEHAVTATATAESVLDLFASQGARERTLETHFRSRHPRLIEFSNERFYDGRLIVFPSPEYDSDKLGVRYHHIPDGIYDRGKTRSNKIEARRVADRVIEHARTSPELSLGVVAFSEAQMDAIYSELDKARKSAPELDSFFDNHRNEPFFVKNLENVQGDERDVLFISIGYGRDAEGEISLNFGPINKPNGENRLNVIASRAKLRREVFTNLEAEDIDLSRTQSNGVRELREFLRDAREGNKTAGDARASGPAAGLTGVIAKELKAKGYTVVENFGTEHCVIDIAVVDPTNPGRMIMGILGDGPFYQNAPSTRDRERIQVETLESLGWNLQRAWSAAWFTDPAGELQRLESSISKVLKGERVRIGIDRTPPAPIERELTRRSSRHDVEISPYELAELTIPKSDPPLAEKTDRELARLVKEVIETESPVHFDEIERRLRKAASIERRSETLVSRIRDACAQAARSDEIRVSGEFYSLTSQKMIVPRDRSEFPSIAKKLSLISPEEIEAALCYTIKHSCGIREDQVVDACCALFGFRSPPLDAAPHIESSLQSLMANNVVKLSGEFLRIVSGT